MLRSASLSRLAIIGAIVLALGVSACGRKGALDLPPSASPPPAAPSR